MEKVFLASVKSKTLPSSDKIYVVKESSISDFVIKHLTPDVVILFDSADTFVNADLKEEKSNKKDNTLN